MKKIASFLFLLLPALGIFNACNGQSGHAIKGVIEGAASLQVMLEQAHFDRSNIALGRATCDAAGNFEIKQDKAFEPGLYRLTIGAKKMFFMLDGTENTVEIKGDLKTIDRLEVQVTGSPTFTCYADIIQGLLKSQVKSADQASLVINQGCNPLMKAFLTTQVLGQNPGAFMDDFRTAAANLNTAMPGSKYAADFSKMVGDIEKQSAQQYADEIIKVGMPAPEISLAGPDGKTHALSSLKGKVVLLDFWASWCGPCRKANPHVVETYKKYKAKGFDVFSVSLDRPEGKDKWIQAIQQDGLLWENHVSDLKWWDSAPAATYGVRAIPKTFLIGRDGKIVAVNPRNNLEEELLKVL
jgi:thiol-disulfide isomerase/thioredoxin